MRGEIKSFIHHFELKHAGGQAPELGTPLRQVREISDGLVDGCRDLLAQTLPTLLEDADLVQSQCQTVLRDAGASDLAKDRTAELQIVREQDWGQFLTEIEQLRAQVDQEFARKEHDLHEHYRRAERKLN
ncbi:biogenesis of lysosome-related organelles complex 1 subunit 5-like isoform X2 [Pollicipes pollicipes]|nr:biogenesis of lysosome-related organelles complex 1 subunit 5-like isoform X2 [Pollicipes pollicipes]